jgi:RimJ/RimL family protein N-acetyltransferase
VPVPSLSLRQLRTLTNEQRSAVLSLQIDAQQIEYAGRTERIVESAESGNPDQVVGLAILEEETVVGFLVLKRQGSAPAWAPAGAAIVSGMRIDAAHQGRGIGSRALALSTSWLQSNWPDCKELALSVDEDNYRGIQAYVRAGLQDSGRREQGRIGWVRFMSRAIEPAGAQ